MQNGALRETFVHHSSFSVSHFSFLAFPRDERGQPMSIVLEHLEKRFAGGCRAVCDLSLEIADGEAVRAGRTVRLRQDDHPADDRRPGAAQRRPHHVGRPDDRQPRAERPQPGHGLSELRPLPAPERRGEPGLSAEARRAPAAEIAAKVRRAAAMLGITRLLDRRPGQLSGGERQARGLGRAIVRQPACFLFDEPLSSLDPHLRAEMRLELRRLHGELRTTSLYVTHDQEEALTLGHRVAVIERGRLQQVGPPLEVYRHPANRFVAAFLAVRR